MKLYPFALAAAFAFVSTGLRAQSSAPDAPPTEAASAATTTSPTQEQEKAAQLAAETWLGVVDEGKYDESWRTAASIFQQAVPQDKWVEQVGMVRNAFGKASGRKLRVIKYMTSVPGAPDGQYVILQYEATFENKKNAVETITPTLDKDGSWKVSGYYIK